jgi:hypothetical protein
LLIKKYKCQYCSLKFRRAGNRDAHEKNSCKVFFRPNTVHGEREGPDTSTRDFEKHLSVPSTDTTVDDSGERDFDRLTTDDTDDLGGDFNLDRSTDDTDDFDVTVDFDRLAAKYDGLFEVDVVGDDAHLDHVVIAEKPNRPKRSSWPPKRPDCSPKQKEPSSEEQPGPSNPKRRSMDELAAMVDDDKYVQVYFI